MPCNLLRCQQVCGIVRRHLAHRAQGRGSAGRQDVTNGKAIQPIPQWYEGIKFRSTLEARWAVFFTEADIRWEYEPEGYVIAGKPYRPDFLLRDCGTWVEVKGDPARLDLEFLAHAAIELPRPLPKCEAGPPLMVLGQLPPVPSAQGDWGFVGLHKAYPPPDLTTDVNSQPIDPELPVIDFEYYGFGTYHKNMRPWWLYPVDPLPSEAHLASAFVLEPWFCDWECCDDEITEAYATARAHRFGRR